MSVVSAGMHDARNLRDDFARACRVAGIFLHRQRVNVSSEQYGRTVFLISKKSQHAAVGHIDMLHSHTGQFLTDAGDRAVFLVGELGVAVEFPPHCDDIVLFCLAQRKNIHKKALLSFFFIIAPCESEEQ
ncbi:hypothetical protein SDC9_76725 [bioreactor metagenome]|uniref:Uncharacterized protein n=1 Tax=bioreactor metagenome TaxID=1076179 RepID=A0A644YNZ6_9ZZZZ